MEQITTPEGTTHQRLNLKKTRMNYFKLEGGIAYIWNNGSWEPFKGNVLSLQRLDASSKEPDLSVIKKTAKTSSKKKASEKPLGFSRFNKDPTKHEGLFATLAEEVASYVPSPVLRQLIEHYKNDDIIEVEIRVKSTHIIKG